VLRRIADHSAGLRVDGEATCVPVCAYSDVSVPGLFIIHFLFSQKKSNSSSKYIYVFNTSH
jgi:hypothetical protein